MDTFNNYTDYTNYPSSEKIILAHVHCKQRLYNWEQVGTTDVWKSTPPYWVTACQDGLEALTKASDANVLEGEYFYDGTYLYVNTTDGFYNSSSDPEIIPTYRLFFSNAPINLSWDLSDDDGEEVPYEPRITSTPNFSTKLDNDQMGISITGSGTLKLINGDNYFEDLYDLFVFENQEADIYSFHRSLDPSQAKVIYKGNITDKTYNLKEVSFKIKDIIHALEEPVPLEKIEDTITCNLSSESEDYYTRKIYGKNLGIRPTPVDQMWYNEEESFDLGEISIDKDSKILTGSGFLQVGKDDTIEIDEDSFKVDQVISNTEIILGSKTSRDYAQMSATCKPEYFSKNFNRKYLIAGHLLYNPSTTISEVNERNRFEVVSTEGFEAGLYLDINGYHRQIKRISNNWIVLTQNLPQLPSVGDDVSLDPVQNVIVDYGSDETEYKNLTLKRTDYSVTEESGYTYITLDDDAEINATIPITIPRLTVINSYKKGWVGKPSVFKYTFPTNSSGGLYGKYFTISEMSDKEEESKGFYFAEKKEADEDQTEEPEITATVSSVSTSNDTLTITGHGLKSGQRVSFESSADDLPSPLQSGYSYYVEVVDEDLIKVKAELTSPLKDLTTAGSGTITMSYDIRFKEVVLSNDTLTATQVAEETLKVLKNELSTYTFTINSDAITCYSKDAVTLETGTSNAGVTINTLMKGASTTDLLPVTPKNFDTIKLDGVLYTINGVEEKSFYFEEVISADTGTYSTELKHIKYLSNEGDLLLDVYGKRDSSGNWIKTASEIVKDLLVEAGLSDRLDDSSFDDAKEDCRYLMSVRIPEKRSDSPPTLKNVLDSINKTVLGSLVLSDDLQISFNILDAQRVEDDVTLVEDNDIISWSIKSKNLTSKRIESKYRFTDKDEDNNYSTYDYTSNFYKYTDAIETLEQDFLLYSKSDIEEAAQRRLFYNSLSRADITVKASLNLDKLSMGDVV